MKIEKSTWNISDEKWKDQLRIHINEGINLEST